jgi:hypothetical protein
MDYLEYCEDIYNGWKSDPDYYKSFSNDFDINYLPQPYYYLREGNDDFVVLNNYPGSGLPFEEHSNIRKKFPGSSYKDLSEWLTKQFTDENTELQQGNLERNKKILQIADTLGYKGVLNVETFFLHTNQFTRNKFIKIYSNIDIVKTYLEKLEEFLRPRTVLIAGSVLNKKLLHIEILKKSRWIQLQAKVAGIDFSKAVISPITKKQNKITSILLVSGNKYMICNMGSSNIPNNTKEVFEESALQSAEEN